MDYNSLLVMADFSPDSDEAVDTAAKLAAKFGAKLKVLHIAHDESHMELYVNEDEYSNIRKRIDEEIEAGFTALEERIPSLKEVDWESAIRRGTPYIEGLFEIEEGGYDLLVIGSHGDRGMKRFLYGSTAEKMLRNSPISVHVTKLPKDE
ncbi:universal stress protein [Limisalsivibrio acetivorans]|uniref:universal stress protein n=1 Tax=Limisalsivibrio acetivorans TaxID=1304888 RepID=UPI0003B41940|nr:universal stress protein [Limisalsivibrio acetivorans]